MIQNCKSCGNTATHTCDEDSGPFVCGAPLCDNCTISYYRPPNCHPWSCIHVSIKHNDQMKLAGRWLTNKEI